MQVVAISCDDQDRAAQIADKVQAGGVKFGYGLSLRSAREWGLHISASRGKTSIDLAIARDCPARGEYTAQL